MAIWNFVCDWAAQDLPEQLPEPGTAALLLAGVALVGFLARHRSDDGPSSD